MKNGIGAWTGRARRWGTAALAALLLLPPLVLENNGYLLRVCTLTLMYAGLGGAWNLLGGLAHQISLGHAAFFGLGAYTSTILLRDLSLSPWLGMLAAALLAGIASLLIGVPTFRLRGHYYALGTLAFAEVLRILCLYFRSFTGGAIGLSVPYLGESAWYFQFYGNRPYYFIALAMLALTMYITHRVSTGPLGYRLRALRNSHEAAEVVGVDTTRAKLQANFLSAVLTGAYGTFYAQYHFFIDPDTVFGLMTFSVRMALIAILGGLGNVWGPLVGAAILVPLDEWTNAVFTGGLAGASRFIYGSLLIVLILWQPRGLLHWFHRTLERLREQKPGAAGSAGRP